VASRIEAVADAVVDAVSDAWNPTAPSEVLWDFLLPYAFEDRSGRSVFFVPTKYGNSPITRGEDVHTYDLTAVVIERYESAGEPTKSWIKERVEFVQDYVVDLLDYSRDPLVFATTRKLTTRSADVVVYVPEKLQGKLFWSEINFIFEEVL